MRHRLPIALSTALGIGLLGIVLSGSAAVELGAASVRSLRVTGLPGHATTAKPRTVAGGRGGVRNVLAPPPATRSIGSSDGKILFNSAAMGSPTLWYSVRPDGSRFRTVLRGLPIGLARLSPDGRMLAYVCGASLCLSGSDGSRRRVLVRSRAGHFIVRFDWSSSGRRLAYTDSRGVWVTNAHGSGRVLIVPTRGRGLELGGGVAWSPRGGWIAFFGRSRESAYTRVYVVRPNGQGLRSLGQFYLLGADRPSWSPDDRFLTFSASRVGTHRWFVFVLDTRTGARRRLGFGNAPAYSPDGTRIAYWDDSYFVRVMSATGGKGRRIGRGFDAVWSAGGDKIAFVADFRTVGVMNADGSARHRVARVPGSVGDAGPLQWTAD